jgi:membrane protein YdbS with pleckstrin-like domain
MDSIHFTNNVLDTKNLPKHQEIVLSSLHKNYGLVVLIHSLITYTILASILFFLVLEIPELVNFKLVIVVVFFFLIALNAVYKYLKLKSKKYAFREHDVVFKNGVVSLETMIIPYNRVQHVGLEEGLTSRYLGLAKVQVFTAGGNSSDLEIPGILKAEAEDIKQLLMGKIQKEL